ncbi:hypothetical protein PG996_000624 [Apiospora saccharicola]|uniref:Cell wall anchored protein n=1 Tax=Apiospora saccharicola TaxID=335842 RepID=A0ABR1WID0_9PEZI
MLLLAFVVAGAITTAQARDPVKDFCRRFGHQTTVIDRKLYIDGGLVNYKPMTSDATNYTNTFLSYLDLDHPVKGDDMPQLYADLAKDSSIPSVHGGILWGDEVNKRFYLFGGEYSAGQPPPADAAASLYAYDVADNRWELMESPPSTIGAVSYGAGVAVSERGEGYYYGGWQSNASNLYPGWTGPRAATTNLIKYDMDAKEFESLAGPTDGIKRAEGVMVYLPISDRGILVYFGGVQDPGNGSFTGQPMDTIHLFDIASSKWYTQHASGDVPDMRRRFCAGDAGAPDGTSYNIYLYGGLGFPPDHGAGFDDVYILSLPTFTWIKMYPGPDSNPALVGSPHHSLSCNVIDGAQMLVMGGSFPLNSTICDSEEVYGTHGLDMGEQNPDKTPVYRKNITSYIVPELIYNKIGGGPQGGARTVPDKGFDDPDIKTLIVRHYTAPERTPASRPGSLSKGAIIGIAVGCGVGAILAFVAGCCCLRLGRRRRKLRLSQSAAGTGPPGVLNSNNAYHHNSIAASSPTSGYTFVPSPGVNGAPFSTPYYHSPAPAPPHHVMRAPVELVGSDGMHELHDRRQYGTPHFSLSTPGAMMMPPPPKYVDHEETAMNSPPTTTATPHSWSRGGSPVTTAEVVSAHTELYTISPLATTPTMEGVQPHQHQQHHNGNGQLSPHFELGAGNEHSHGPLSSGPITEQPQQQQYHGPAAASAPLRDREQPRVQARDGGNSQAETVGEGPRHQSYYHK